MGDGLLPRDRLAAVSVPVLAVAGGASPEWMHRANQAVAEAVPQGTYRVLPGQTHMVEPDVLGPVLTEFFTGGAA
jgi:pimeloyl-ACP methyl ester carboxylesterase